MVSSRKELVRYSFVVPVLNEELVLPAFFERLDALIAKLDGLSEVLLIDDGSTDRSVNLISAKALADARYRLISFSRNFGHQIAITAGLDYAVGDAVIVLDSDLQDPPELVLAMVEKWKSGVEIVYAERTIRAGESWAKRLSADMFYRLLRRLASAEIPRNVGDFRLVDRKVVDVFRSMNERDPFVRGMFAWTGFRQAAVPYERSARIAGQTKYPFRKMFRLALHGLVGFSDAPLRLALWVGFGVSTIAGIMSLYIMMLVIYDHTLVRGWASTMVLVSFLCGINLFTLGVVGLYVGRIHTEVKKRPLYVIARTVGVETSEPDVAMLSDRRVRNFGV